MESTAKRLFLAIQERIAAEVPAVKFIDLDMGQLGQAVRPAILFPAVLINYDSITSRTSPAGRKVTADIRVTVVLESYLPSTQDVAPEMRSEAMEFLDMEHDIVTALHGWQPEGITRTMLDFRGSRGQSAAEYRLRDLMFEVMWWEENLYWKQGE